MEEECQYLGNVVEESPSGSIVDYTHCKEFCDHIPLCVYWRFELQSNQCFLLDSKDRICSAVGGPQEPPLPNCLGIIS